MTFFVHNAHLHMTNVNTIEDKRITPPTVIMILVLYCCVVRMSACTQVCACVYAFVCGTFLCRQNVCEHVCVSLKATTKPPSGLSQWMCVYETHCHSEPCFWSSSKVEWHQADTSKGAHLERPLMQGAPSWNHSLLYSTTPTKADARFLLSIIASAALRFNTV